MDRTLASPDLRLGFWSALGIVILGVAYLGVGLTSVMLEGTPDGSALTPADPYLAVLETLVVLCAGFTIALFAAIHGAAAPAAKARTRAALGCAIAFATLTSVVHFVTLVFVRQVHPPERLRVFESLFFAYDRWPTVALAVDLFAWCPVLGVTLLFAAPAFAGDRLQTAIRVGMTISGALCVLGTLGPVTGNMDLTRIGTAGYAFGFTIVCGMMALWFGKAGRRPVSATHPAANRASRREA